jgi:hypothetical protein
MTLQTDYGNHMIRKINVTSGYVATLAGHVGVSTPFSDGIGTDATFSNPTGVAFDKDGIQVLVVRTLINLWGYFGYFYLTMTLLIVILYYLPCVEGRLSEPRNPCNQRYIWSGLNTCGAPGSVKSLCGWDWIVSYVLFAHWRCFIPNQ